MSSQSRNVTSGSVCSIPTDTLSQMKAGITWGKWVFVCLTLRGIYKFNAIFDLYQSLTKAPQTRKIPGKFWNYSLTKGGEPCAELKEHCSVEYCLKCDIFNT